MVKTLEKVVKDAIAGNKYKSGTKEVLRSLKGSKLIIISKSVSSKDRSKLQEQSKSSNIPVYHFYGNSIQLGKLCNKPFRISAIALKSGADVDINAILTDKGNESANANAI
jgi:large subunit ribosomal protein L30e